MVKVKKEMQSLMAHKLSIYSQCGAYHKHWGDEFTTKEVVRGYDLKGVFSIGELSQFDRDDLYQFGFGNWDDSLVLFPLWIVNSISDDEIVTDINNKEISMFEAKKDLDVRGGAVAFGFIKP